MSCRRATWDSGTLVCIIHTMQSRELIRLLVADGWQLDRVRGSHHEYRHPYRTRSRISASALWKQSAGRRAF